MAASRVARTIPILIAVCLVSLPAQAKYGGGTGKPDDPYLIYTPEHMNTIGAEHEDWDKDFKLMADIDLGEFTSTDFNIIGFWHDGSDNAPFSGVFDGNGHTISNLICSSVGANYIGLFGYVYGTEAEIKNLDLIDPNIDAGTGHVVGSLVGLLREGTVTNCYAKGGSVVGARQVGGLIGQTGFLLAMGRAYNPRFENGFLIDCYSTVNVTGKTEVGGLVGSNKGIITNCYATGTVAGDRQVGGLAGDNVNTVTACFSNGIVSGNENVGGLVGYILDGIIDDCNSAGAVDGQENVGGLVGENVFRGTIANCRSSASVLGTRAAGGLIGYNNGNVASSFSTGDVAGNDYVGGLVGRNYGNSCSCFSIASVSGQGNCAGGLIGYNYGTVTNAYSSGPVTGNYIVGGLIGGNERMVMNCYATGAVSGNGRVGGLQGSGGWAQRAFLSFWDVDASGQLQSAGGTGKTTAEMRTSGTFLGWGACVNEGMWTIDEGRDYPKLLWEEKPGETIKPIYISDFLAGAGTSDDAYLIHSKEQLNMIGLFPCEWDKHFKLMADIDVSSFTGKTYNVIGFHHVPFTGTFDGNGHSISNFNYDSDDEDYTGLFGYALTAEISNLGLIDSNIEVGTRKYVGGIVGYLKGGRLANCYVENVKISSHDFIGDLSHDYVGGLAGYSSGTVTGCRASGEVWGNDCVGILIGNSSGGVVENCHSAGVATGDSHIGGLVGSSGGKIVDSYSVSDVSARANAGGLVGSNGQATITNCYSNGQVVSSENTGGLSGTNFQGTIENSYSMSSVSGGLYTGGLTGFSYKGAIMNSCSKGNVEGSHQTGGVVGWNSKDSSITNCYCSGNVQGSSNVGGIAGWNGRGSIEAGEQVTTAISNCYSSGRVTGTRNVGALVGDSSKGEVKSSFWDIETNGQGDMCAITDSWTIGCDNTYGKQTLQMQAISTYLEAGWDFADETENGAEDIWWILEGQGYPRLWWEETGN